jgi:hypothetical protein
MPLVPAASRLESRGYDASPKARKCPDAHLSLVAKYADGAGRGRLTTAYEQELRAIGIVDRGDPLADLLARKIIEVAQTSAKPADISAQAINEIGIAT